MDRIFLFGHSRRPRDGVEVVAKALHQRRQFVLLQKCFSPARELLFKDGLLTDAPSRGPEFISNIMPEKEGQIKSLLPYDTSRGGQLITQIDLSIVDSNRKSKLYNYASAKMEDIKKQYDDTIALWEWNEFVDSFKIGFEPVVGKTYYLYETSTKFLSILSPAEFRRECVGITKLNSDGYWEKILK